MRDGTTYAGSQPWWRIEVGRWYEDEDATGEIV
jgi:hypothetical protein